MIYSYEQAKGLLQSQGKFYINLGLDRIKKLLSLIDNPQEKIKIIHIAGTNGKGSVCAFLANILCCSGYKVGLYTSPHLVEYTERIKINNEEIEKSVFGEYVGEICEIADKNGIDLTEFEILTADAYKYFYDNRVDIAVIETGLGGRFDATNVVKNPLCSVITSISLDHTDRLGKTYEEIAFEKAGIIKENSCAITSSENNGFDVIKKVAEEKKAKFIGVQNEIQTVFENGTNYVFIDEQKIDCPLIGLYQRKNLALVLAAVTELKNFGFNISNEAVFKGIQTIKWSARLEFVKDKNLIIDGAHNPDAALELRKTLDYCFLEQKRIFIYSTIDTKDFVQIAKTLFREDDEIYYLNFNYKNAVKFEDYVVKVDFLKNLKQIEINLLPQILTKNELKIVTGSLYMIGEIYNLLKNNENIGNTCDM